MPISYMANGLRLDHASPDADWFLRFDCVVDGVLHTVQLNATKATNAEFQTFVDRCAQFPIKSAV